MKRALFANKLVVEILNTTDGSALVNITVKDLTADSKQKTENALLIRGNSAENLILSRLPAIYEVIIEGIPPGVHVFTFVKPNLHWKFIKENKSFSNISKQPD